MEGLSQMEPAKGTHDDLFVRALCLQQGGNHVLILGYDLLFFEQSFVDRLKGAVGRFLNLAPREIFINFTHTHAGPRLTEWAYGGKPCPYYLDHLVAQTIKAAKESVDRLVDVTLTAGETATTIPVNRRKLDEHGKAQWVPDPGQTVYDKLPYAFLRDVDGNVVSILFSIACHPSMIYKGEISAEFPGAAMRFLNEKYRTEGSIFLQGAAGDAKPRAGARDGYWGQCSWEEMDAVGREITDAIIADFGNQITIDQPFLHTELKNIPWLLEPVPSDKELEAVATGDDPFRKKWVADLLRRREVEGSLADEWIYTVQVVELAPNLRLVGVAGEVLAILGWRIRECFPDGITFVLGYSNGTRIYMPVSDQLAEGGYEVDSYWEYHVPSRSRNGAETPLLNYLADYAKTRGIGILSQPEP